MVSQSRLMSQEPLNHNV